MKDVIPPTSNETNLAAMVDACQKARRILQIKSKTTLQQLKNEGQIRFSQPKHKILLYDRDSLYEYLERHARETF